MPQDRRLRLNFHNHICKYFLLDQIFLIIFLISLFQLATLNAVEEIYEWNSTTADSLFINDNNRTDSAPPSSAEYNKENIDGSGEALLSIANEEESDRQVVKLLNGDWADYTASTTDLEGSGDDLNEMAPTHTTPSTTTQITTFRRRGGKPTVSCPDGSVPEFSLHGSTYCWSHSVCPSGTACIEGQCCKSALASKIRKCPETEWECSAKCIPRSKRCDGKLDCVANMVSGEVDTEDDFSDEIFCTGGNEKRSIGTQRRRCSAGEYACKSGECIISEKVCDHRYNCKDGSDESRCDYFLNAQHDYLRRKQPNSALLEGRPCTEEEFRCPNLPYNLCLHYDALCNARNDCGDWSDEKNCESKEQEDDEDDRRRPEGVPIGACAAGEFQCIGGSRRCIPGVKKCNREYDCQDGSDELDCNYFVAAHRRNPNYDELATKLAEDTRRRLHHERYIKLQQEHRQRLRQQQDSNRTPQTDDLQITVYPHELTVREGREASFECRARTSDNAAYAQVRWTRVGGRLPENVYDSGGRLTFNPAHLSHSGRYACVATNQGRSVEAYATLNVQSFGPQEFQQNTLPDGPSAGCMADEKACGSNECVKADYVCDGEPDCRDRSDEMNCPTKRHCEPNEFRCANNRCVQKMWLCDGDDDCGDRSDEQNCKQRKPGDLCQATEFRCNDGRQCVPQSFQCDGTNDCHDGSDEIGCVQPTVVQAPDSNRVVSQGSDLKLTCRAVGVPDPYINWRLNWGPVCEPPRCQQVSEGGVGTLTIQEAQPLDQGAYTCEAINVKGRVLATPDCIVRIVNIPAPPPPPPAQPQVTCHPQGAITPYPDTRGKCQCKPEVVGPTCGQCSPGSYNLDEKSPQGCMKCFCFGITNQCRSSNYFRTKEKLFFAGDSQGIVLADIDQQLKEDANFEYEHYGFLTHKEPHAQQTLYWKLPQRFLGNKVTAYGGQMAVQLQYEGSGSIRNEPLIVLKGNGITLVHTPRDQENIFIPNQPFTVTIPTLEHQYEHLSGGPASREDLMMVLANLDAYLIRATHVDDQQSTSLGDVSWEIAVDRDTQDVRALEVEQCDCPPGYIGTSCEDCAPGYERSGSGPYLGTCVPRRAPPAPQCSSVGAISVQPSYDGRCQCKQNTVGATCDRCAPGSFQMSPNNPQGCLKCFCSGVTNQCDSSSLRRCTVEIDYARGARDQLEAITKDARSPFRPPTQPQVYDGAINFNGFYEARGQTLYWKMPQKFVGNKISSYGGKLKYVFRFTGSGNLNPDPDVIIRGNDITLHHYNRNPVQADRDNTVEIPILEDRWQRSDGQPATREHLLMALADTDDILIKMSYMSDCSSSSLVSAILDCADQYGPGPQALEVEECQCPIGYVGTSCEDCAPGYSRTGGGLYLGLCEKCECNGHASECDKEYGTCVNCQHNTEGDQCERCKPGFEGDARRGTPYDCQQQIAAKPPCQCYNHSPRGCDSFGRCLLCEHNTEGFHCETCKKGFYGDATRGTPYDCTPCPCPGASDCFLDSSGQVQCRNCPAGFSGRLCDECAPGYTRSQASGGRDCEPIGRVYPDHITFVPEAEAPLHVQILPPKHLSINEGSRAKWTCKVSEGYKPEQVDLRWTKIGEPDIPSHVRIQGNQLIIDSVRMSDAGQYRCTGSTPKHIATDDASLIVLTPQIASPHTQTPKPIVTPPHQIVDENQQAVFTCLTPGFADCEVEWHFNQVGSPLPPGVYKRGNQVFIPAVQTHHAGDYICTVQHQFGRSESNPGRLEIKKAPLRPMVDPPEHNVEVGDPARFRCWVPGVPDAVLTWRPIHGGALPAGSEQRDGFLNFPRADLAHEGQYICAAHDPSDDPTGSRPVDSEPVRLNIRQPTVSLPPAVQQAPQVDPLFQTVDVGQPAKIRCWVPGDPNARLRWSTHHHRPLPAGATDQEGILTFPSVSEADDGGYICSVSDPQTGGPIHSPVARIHVRRPQKPQIDPPEQTVRRGQPARIRCWVPDSPHSQLTWNRRGGAPLPDGARDDGRGNLYIAQTQSHHVGDYECTATDPQAPDRPPQVSDPGRISLQPPVEEAVETPGQPPRPVATPPILTVKRGEEARFHCDANSPSPAEIHWGYGSDNGPLRGDTVQEGDDVVIPAADDADAGEYICSATNRFGSGRSDPVRLVITDNEEPPTARVEPKVWNGKPGERHQFKCHTTGIPPPQVSWSKNGGNGLPDDVVDLGDGVLEISNARKEHEGDYTCHAVNIVGEASDFGTVNVGPSLTVITTPAGPKIILTVGEPLEVKCEAFGDPDPDVEWLHDPGPERGDLPDDFVPVTISEQFIRHPKIGLGNAGRYTCKGSNQFASVTRDIYIEVVEPSHLATVAILGGTNQWFPVGQEAQLVCAASGSSVVDRLEWTSAGSSNLPAEASDQGEPGLLHFDTFKPSHEGEYECNAYRKDELIASSKVHIYSDANLRPDVVHVEISPPNVRVVNKGDSIVLDCIVHGHSDDFKYSWSLARGGSLIRQLGKESQLTIKSADPTNDYGIYRCEVDNEEGDTVGSAQVAVAVGYESSANAQEAKFDESSEAILTCPVFVVPGATVSWTKQGDDLPTNSEQKDNKLVIENFDDTAAGIYTCTVIYGQSTVEGFVNAKIFVPDTTIKVEMKVSAESVHVGERVWLDCVVVGDANAKIEFSKDGSDKLPSNAQVTGNRLIFTEISEENTGKYLCTASTSEGQLIASALLNVEPSKRKRKDLPSRHSTHGSRRVFAVAPAASSSLSPTVAALTQPQLSASLDPQNPLAVSQQRLRRLRQQRRRRIASRRQKLKRFSDHEPAVTQNKGRIQRHHSSFKDSAKYHHYDVKHPSIEQPAKSVFGSWFASN